MQLRRCHVQDLRIPGVVPCEPRLSADEAVLWISRAPLVATAELQGYELIRGPSLYMRLEALPCPASPCPGLDRQRQHLKAFEELRQLALQGQPFRQGVQELQRDILELLVWEEQHLYPALSRFLGNERPLRERGYEHQGIRRWLPELDAALEQVAQARRWERFSLDLIHLMEHHLEYDETLYELAERL